MKCKCGKAEEENFPANWLKKYPEIKGMCLHCFNEWQINYIGKEPITQQNDKGEGAPALLQQGDDK